MTRFPKSNRKISDQRLFGKKTTGGRQHGHRRVSSESWTSIGCVFESKWSCGGHLNSPVENRRTYPQPTRSYGSCARAQLSSQRMRFVT